ncbi:MAG: hypothetical protein RIQ93_3060 [Verrucomicrobiota bacterium]|jgi:hypothetical protein
MFLARVIAAVWAVALPLSAQEVTAGVGAMRSSDPSESSYAWQLDYRLRLGRDWAWSASWINEGHVDGHHRDGLASQLWGQPRWPTRPVALTFGLGAYGYFDTQQEPDRETRIQRGWGPIASVALTYYTAQPWFWRLTLNAIRPSRSIPVNTLTLAAGYALDGKGTVSLPHPSPPLAPVETHSREINLLFGQSVVNATGRHAFAAMVEYRVAFRKNWEWTLAALREGNTGAVNRDGAVAEIWLVDSWQGRRFSLGIGAGGYYSHNRARVPGDRPQELFGIVSPTAAWRFADPWKLRVIWHRVISDDRHAADADVFLLGVGRGW